MPSSSINHVLNVVKWIGFSIVGKKAQLGFPGGLGDCSSSLKVTSPSPDWLQGWKNDKEAGEKLTDHWDTV